LKDTTKERIKLLEIVQDKLKPIKIFQLKKEVIFKEDLETILVKESSIWLRKL
jgi:hypothetical protein